MFVLDAEEAGKNGLSAEGRVVGDDQGVVEAAGDNNIPLVVSVFGIMGISIFMRGESVVHFPSLGR